jgi:hypothetical protein
LFIEHFIQSQSGEAGHHVSLAEDGERSASKAGMTVQETMMMSDSLAPNAFIQRSSAGRRARLCRTAATQ